MDMSQTKEAILYHKLSFSTFIIVRKEICLIQMGVTWALLDAVTSELLIQPSLFTKTPVLMLKHPASLWFTLWPWPENVEWVYGCPPKPSHPLHPILFISSVCT